MEDEKHHLQPDEAHAYEIETIAAAQAFGLRCAIIWVCATPSVYLVCQFLAAILKIQLALDDRLLIACIAGIATILAFGFKSRKKE